MRSTPSPPDATNVFPNPRARSRGRRKYPRRAGCYPQPPSASGRACLLPRLTSIKFTAKVKDRLIVAAAGVAVVVLTTLRGLILKSLDEMLHAGEPF